MPVLQEIEEQKEEKPILCIVSENSILSEKLVSENFTKFKIILISSHKISPKEEIPDLYPLNYQEAQVLPNLKEKIDYAVITFSEDSQKKWLPEIIKKLKVDRSKSLLLLDVFNFQNNYDLILATKNSQNFYIALLGEVISKKKNETDRELSKFIHKGLVNERVTVSNEENFSVFPIFLNDALENIYRLLFGTFKNTYLYFLFYKNPETLLSAIHIMARIQNEINVSFVDESLENESYITIRKIKEIATQSLQMDSRYLDSKPNSFEDGLRILFESKWEAQKEKIIITTEEPAKKIKRDKNFKTDFFVKSIIGGVVLFLFLNLLILGSSIFLLYNAVGNIESEQFHKVKGDTSKAKLSFNIARPFIYNSYDLISMFDKEGKAYEKLTLFENAIDLISRIGLTITFATDVKNLSSTEKLESILSDFTYLYLEGERMLYGYENSSLRERLRPEYSKILSFSSILRPILGFENKKNYLILFQNNYELRPSGGFIGSIGEISVDKGKFGDLLISDVYELDGQLKTHIDPPFVVGRYLQQHLYLRDSNFALDFEEASKKAAVIYNLETGKTPDAIIAINLSVLEEIIKVVGQIEIPEYKIKVDSNNIGTIIQDTITKNNFPGSTSKKDILNKVLSQLILEAQSDQKKSLKIVRLLPKLLEEKNILFSFDNESLQKIFRANGYSDSLKDTRENIKNRSNDYLYVNEANIGVNKVNEFIEREIKYDASITPEGLKSSLKIDLRNKSSKDNYRAYIQIAVPKGSRIDLIKINDTAQTITRAITDKRIYQAKGFIAPVSLEVEQAETKDYMIFAFITNVISNSKNLIDISYSNGASVPITTVYNYSLKYIKQPGTPPYNFTNTVFYPENYSPSGIEFGTHNSNFVSEKREVKKDFDYNIGLIESSIKN